ncbi:multidrug effflux MFS transporter [uncultured Cohaesibacter sp.]|uniref:multidrug effflux MFS transporter n=1 Tax=uncultured Cohaesibacter sp. TaxID=1002546 RepID=UPI0029C81A2C|nr:multidrug effflux MFS transporter [uncultured Cohaesibacter sp.]
MSTVQIQEEKANSTYYRIVFISILGALMAFTSLSTDIYLPAMPKMAEELHGDAELTVTGFLIGFAIAQLIWGPISDHIGRRKPLFIGMLVFVVGSVGCAMAQSIEQIVFWRVFQAFGACTGPMLSRAMIRDLYTRTRAAQMLSTLVMVMAIAPIAGPLLGGQIIRFSSWHAIFWLLAVIGLLMFLSIFKLPETLPAKAISGENRSPASIMSALRNYIALMKNREFMRYTLCVTFYYTSAYGFIIGSPFVYINYYGVDYQYYGYLFACNIVGVITMSYFNRFLLDRFSMDLLLRLSTGLSCLSMLALAGAVYSGVASLPVMIITIFIFFALNGIIAATATAAALDEVKTAGSASALIGSLQYGSGIISSLLLTFFRDGTPWPMAWIMALFTLASLAVLLLGRQQAG